MKIHKEGYKTIFIATGFAITITAIFGLLLAPGDKLPLLSWLLPLLFLVIVVQFFRSPKRKINLEPDTILSPADGKIVVVEETTEPEFFKKPMIQVSIFMSPLNVHLNRYPVSGKIIYKKHHQGKYLVAWNPKSSLLNERTSIGFETETGYKLLLHQVAGFLARRIVCYCNEKQEVVQGNELGFIKFGSRVDIYLPTNSQINVKIGDNVKGGVTKIATLN